MNLTRTTTCKAFKFLGFMLCVFCIPIFTSCRDSNAINKEAKGFILTGKFTDIPDSTLVEVENLFTREKDSTYILNGKFIFEGNVAIPTPFNFIAVNNENRRPYFYETLFVENNQISLEQLEGDILVTGSQSHQTRDNYYSGLRPIWKEFNPVLSKRSFNKEDSISLKKYFKASKSHEINFYKNHPDSYFSVYNLMSHTIKGSTRFNELKMTKSEMSELYETFSVEIRNSPYGKVIKNYLELPESSEPKVGDHFSDFTLPNSDGKLIHLSDFKGKYVLVDFWASWCRPCRVQNPKLRKLYEKYKSNNFEIIGVSIDKKEDAWLKAIKKDGLEWTNIIDIEGRHGKVAQLYGINGIPDNMLINPEGIIINRKIRSNEVENVLSEIFE